MTTDDLVEAPPLPTGRRFALVIATSTYDHPEYHDLPATAQDATAMRDMLGDPDICAFEVQTLVDRTAPEIRIAINKVFNERRAGDLVLVYFSGHGVKDDDGRLHFVATDTDPATLQATAVSSRYLLDLSGAAAADRQIIVLDCCFSGAYDAKGVGFADLLTLDEMEDETASIGRYFITASRGAEYSFQKRRRDGEVAGSVFTTAFVDGVRTGLADVNNTGRITIQDAYRHAFTVVTRDSRRRAGGLAAPPPSVTWLKVAAMAVAGVVVVLIGNTNRGAGLVVVVNPMRPLLRDPKTQPPLVDGGPFAVAGQALRIAIHRRLHDGLARHAYTSPATDFVLLEPYERDLRLFDYPLMTYSLRHEVVRRGYRTTVKTLLGDYERYADVFERNRVTLEIARDTGRQIDPRPLAHLHRLRPICAAG